jgi:ubiquinone/menaquinone biosynthesis C-methylase UbiE
MSTERVPFDRAVDFYDQTRGFPPGEEAHITALIARAGELQPETRLLEVGIGTGRIAVPLAQHCRNIYGLDLSLPMMQRLRAKAGNDSIRLVRGDAAALPFPAASFERVLTVHILHLVPDLAAVLAEIARVMSPGGCLLHCKQIGSNVFRPLHDVWNSVLNRQKQAERWSQIESMITAAGWQQIGDKYTHNFERQRSPQNEIDNLKNRISSSTWPLTDEEHSRGLAAVEKAAAEQFADLTQSFTLRETFNLVVYRPLTG